MERMAQALHAVSLPNASGGMARLRGYIDAQQLADELLGIAVTLRDQDALGAATQATVSGPDDGRAGVLADLLGHYSEFSAILDRLDGAQHGNDAQSRFNALVDLARLLDVEPKNKPAHKFNPGTVPGQLADKKKVREPLQSAAEFQATTAPDTMMVAASDPPTASDLQETVEVQLTANITAQAQQLGNDPVAIRNWVYNNIDFVPSFGSTQNSQRTLLARRGNAFDTSSLLIALLRSAGIPARYVYGTVDLPVDKVRNWLGDLPDGNSAADLLVKSGIPTVVVTVGGTIQFLRVEHVWVEAYVDFSPSRGARNRTPDTWVPLDASFKAYTNTPSLPVMDHVSFNAGAAQVAMLAGSQRGANWITAISPVAVRGVNDQVTQQVAGYLGSQDISDAASVLGKRSVKADNTPIFAGSLPYAIKSAQTYRYDALPANLQQTISVSLYGTPFEVDGDAPQVSVTMPLARIGTSALQVEYRGATAAADSLIQQYAAANSVTLSASSLSVVPQLKLGGTVLKEGAAVVYGTQQYWRAAVANPTGAFATPPDPSAFPAGTAIAFVVDTSGTTPDYAQALTADYGNRANLSIADALATGGLQYFLLHDMFDDMVAQARHATVVRLPSVGTFATAVSVSYFFGLPRTASTQGFVTDVKALRYAVVAPTAEEGVRTLAQMGVLGSFSEGATWSLLTGRDVAGSLSAATLLLRANEAQIPIYELSQSNVSQDLPTLSLTDDDKTDIQNAVGAGQIVLVPAREMRVGSWSGVGYVVMDPTTGAGAWRVSGGLNGAIDVGCIVKAISLNVLCNLMFDKLLHQFIALLNPGALLATLATRALVAFVPIVGQIIAVVQLALTLIDITMQVLKWVRGIVNMIEDLSAGDLAELGIAAFNDFVCSLGSPCFGNNYFDDIKNNFSIDGIAQGFSNNFAGGLLAGLGGGAPGEPAAGNPVSVGNGIKWQWERDYDGGGAYPLKFVRTYNSAQTNGSVVGNKWTHTYQSSIHVAPAPLGSDATPQNAVDAVLATHGDGTYSQYVRRGSAYVVDSNIPEPLVRLADGGGNTAGWEVTRLSDEVEHYDATGRLQWVQNRAGLRHTLTYDATGQVTSVSDDFGRSLQFTYDPATAQLATLTDPDNKVTTYRYDANRNITSVMYSDAKTREYLYEDATLKSYLTGIVDERGIRYATFAYDYRGRAILSTHSDGAGKITLSYGDNTTTVTDAIGTVRTYSYTLINQRQYLIKVDQPCSAGCSAGGVSKQSFDGNGFVATRTDFNNSVITTVHNGRGLITSRTEATGTTQARTTTAQWHATYHLPSQIAEPLPGGATRTDKFDYDAQGNLQTVTASAGAGTRQWSYSYNNRGQVLTAKSPRTDLAGVVSYKYDNSTGNLQTMTDAVNHQTQYTDYDAHGHLLEKVDPNGLITTYDYDLRGRMTSVTEHASASDAGETTVFDYDGVGELKKLTLPDGSYLTYTYDDAQRLTDVADSLGNTVHYTLDGLGDRTKEDTNDPNRTLAQTLSRVMNALGRLEELHGAQTGEISRYTYDDVGNEKSASDPLQHATTSTYDGLNRLQQTNVLDAANPAHAEIDYDYDVRDNLTSVTDPRQLVTKYAYSGFDELNTLTSPDTGITQYQYDPAGNLTVQTDARGKRGLYAYDPADRLTQIQYGAGGSGNTLASTEEVVSFGYDEPTGGTGAIGRLTHADVIGTPLGTSHLGYQYDTHGRVTQKAQLLGNAQALTTHTHYNSAGQRDEVTLPSGAVINYAYGADGRVMTIAVNGIVIVRDIAYFPFGDPQGWTEATIGGGASYTRQYDTDGRIASHRDGSVNRQLAYDPASRVTASVDSGIGGTANWTYGYDDQDRLTSASNAAQTGTTSGTSQTFAYDATGNRTRATNGDTATTYTIDSQNNRLVQVGAAARNFDAAGNTTDWIGPVGTVHATYSARNRLSQTQSVAPLATYAYNAWGERVGKQGASYTQFVYDDDGHLQGEYDQTGRLIEETLWLDDTPVATLKLKAGAADGSAIGGGSATQWQGLPAGGVEVFWIEPDQVDSPRAIVNQTHQLVWQWDSDPFGSTLPSENPSALAAFSYNLRFPGQYFDAETQTHYNYFRDYDPQTGTYAESDPSGLDGGINTFSYVDSSPIWDADLSGEAPRSRAGRNGKLRSLLDDPNQPKCWRGWVKQEINNAARGGRGVTKTRYLRNPPDLVWRHPPGSEASKGFDYSCTCAQNRSIHDIETRAQGRQGGWFGAKRGGKR
jgi:RHS repeat-associated protein